MLSTLSNFLYDNIQPDFISEISAFYRKKMTNTVEVPSEMLHQFFMFCIAVVFVTFCYNSSGSQYIFFSTFIIPLIYITRCDFTSFDHILIIFFTTVIFSAISAVDLVQTVKSGYIVVGMHQPCSCG